MRIFYRGTRELAGIFIPGLVPTRGRGVQRLDSATQGVLAARRVSLDLPPELERLVSQQLEDLVQHLGRGDRALVELCLDELLVSVRFLTE